jgi:hypothetical protein
MLTITRKPDYATAGAENRVYLHDEATNTMVFRSAHTTYQLALAELRNCLQAGYTGMAELHNRNSVYRFTLQHGAYGTAHGTLVREKIR